MTKSSRHKQLRKVELNKLKLKRGKKLKKAQNETRTEFKARKIIIKEQLAQKDPNVVATKKKLNLKDLTLRLKHHSVYVRQDGLDGIKEIVGANTREVLAPDVASIVQHVVPCIQDSDVLIRKTAVKIIDMLLTKVGVLINPYLGIVSSNLCCAMVHLDSGVQTDSLNLMEALIKHVPSVIARNADTLLDNFLFLIARRIKRASEDVSQSCQLISNPNSTHATIKWRIQLLKSLSGYLDAVLSDRSKEGRGSQEQSSIRNAIIIGCLPPLLNKSGSANSFAEKNTSVLLDENRSRDFVSSLAKILFEVWAEVDIGSEYSVQGNPLNSQSVEVLLCISQIVLQLFKLVELVFRKDAVKCGWFIEVLRKKFQTDILPGFPYSFHGGLNYYEQKSAALEDSFEESSNTIGEKSNKAEKNGPNARMKKKVKERQAAESNCQQLNINLASIAMSLDPENGTLRQRISDYYADFLQEENVSAHIPSIVDTCCRLLPYCDLPLGERLLQTSLDAFSRTTSYKKALIQIPLKATEWDCQFLWRSAQIRKWIEALLREGSASDVHKDYIYFVLVQFKLRNVPNFQRILRESGHFDELLNERT